MGCPVNTSNVNCTSDPLLLSRIVGAPHTVLNESTQLSFYSVWFDGAGTDQALFFPPLVNNNITFERCLISDFHGNVTVDIEACEEVVTVSARSTRFKRIWGSALYVQGIYSWESDNVTYDRCGGLNGYPCLYLKNSFISKGVNRLVDSSHWLLFDNQNPECNFFYDSQGMVRCVNGETQCYSAALTEYYGLCDLVNITNTNVTSNETATIIEYDPGCRVYIPCECAGARFDVNGTEVVLPVADLYFFTGLPCVALANATLLNATGVTFLGSNAGDPFSEGGLIGVPPPAGDTGWNMGVIALDNTIIMAPVLGTNFTDLFLPPGAVAMPDGISYSLDGGVTVAGLIVFQLNASQSDNETLVEAACYCNLTALNASLSRVLGCNYTIDNITDTIFDVMSGVQLPNYVFGAPLKCQEGQLLCLDEECSVGTVPCECPFQQNYTAGSGTLTFTQL